MRQSSIYMPAIDSMRAIAVLAVIIFHSNFLELLPGGYTGVDMFFVISGYVISHSLYARKDLSLADYLKGFYRRRLLRILPALLVVLLVSFILSAMFMPQFWLSELINRTGLAAFFGLSNFVLAWSTDNYFSPGAELNPYLHTWSLGLEEQFYVIFPIIYFLWLRYKHRAAIVWVMLPLLAAASLMISAFQTRADPLSAFYLLPGRFWELASGALLFQVIGTQRFSLRSKNLSRILLPTGLALLLTGFLFAQRNHSPFPWALATVLGTLLMIAAVVVQAQSEISFLHRLLQSSLTVYIGRLSYSLYLWHWPVAVLFRWTTGLELITTQIIYPVIVFALATASYHWVELPFRSGSPLLQKRSRTTVVSGLVMAGLLFYCGAKWVADHPETLSLSQTRNTYEWYAYKHFPQEEIDKIEDPLIVGRQIFVIGDSHTAAYRTMLNIMRLKLGIKIVEYEQGGCGVATLIGPDPANCATRRLADFNDIEAKAKPGDIVFLASLRMPELHGREWARGELTVMNEVLAEQTVEMNTSAKVAASDILERLKALRVHVVIDAPKVLFKAPPNLCSDWFNKMNPVCSPGLTIDRKHIERLRAPQMRLLASLKREYPHLTVWDPLPLLCPGNICSAFDKDGKPLFFDSNHLSGHGNRVLTPSFTEVVLTLWRSAELENEHDEQVD